MADAIGQDGSARRHRQCLDHRQRRVGFEPGDDAALRPVELGPPVVIVIAQVKHIGRPRLDRHRLGRGDVVDIGGGDHGIDRPVAVGIIDDVHLGAACRIGKARPRRAAPIKLEAARIDQINRIAQRPAQMPVGAADHPREPLAENRGRAVRIGIGQGRALHRPRAEMVQPRPMALQTREISRRLAAPASWP